MPTYDYKCKSCGKEWELLQSIKDEPETLCRFCGKEFARRLISGPGNFVLRGDGWFKDGYSKAGDKGK